MQINSWLTNPLIDNNLWILPSWVYNGGSNGEIFDPFIMTIVEYIISIIVWIITSILKKLKNKKYIQMIWTS